MIGIAEYRPTIQRVTIPYMRPTLILMAIVGLATTFGCDNSITRDRGEKDAPPVDPWDIPDGWQQIEAGDAFTFYAPADLEEIPVQGVDSFVGRYTSPALVVEFDYGWYSDPLDGDHGPEWNGSWTRIGGKRARIARSGDLAGVHFPEVKRGDLPDMPTKLTLTVRAIGDNASPAKEIFRTIRFK